MIPLNIQTKMGRNLHLQPNHPISITRKIILEALKYEFPCFEFLDPRVSVEANFDSLLIPKNHPSRNKSDTYYFNEQEVLRTHTSAHQVELLKAGYDKFIVIGDVYRNDDIDATHHSVFHQLEGIHLTEDPEKGLKETLAKVVSSLFGDCQWHMPDDYFPFTDPSWEVVVNFNGEPLEIGGCGIIHPQVLANAGITDKTGWAFGLGLDRLAMKLFQIPDIRLLWSEDSRFLSQFQDGKITKFVPYSKHPPCYKDISMWVPDGYSSLDFFGLVRNLAGDLVESVKEIDCFTTPSRTSITYRIIYRSWDRTLTNEEINDVQQMIRNKVVELGVTVR